MARAAPLPILAPLPTPSPAYTRLPSSYLIPLAVISQTPFVASLSYARRPPLLSSIKSPVGPSLLRLMNPITLSTNETLVMGIAPRDPRFRIHIPLRAPTRSSLSFETAPARTPRPRSSRFLLLLCSWIFPGMPIPVRELRPFRISRRALCHTCGSLARILYWQ